MNYERQLIILNSSHYVPNSLTSYRYKLPTAINTQKARVSLQSLSMYHSTFNISSYLNNNTFSVKWINNATYNFRIPDGYYSLSDLNYQMQFLLRDLNLYAVKNNTDTDTEVVVYYFNLRENSTFYKAEFTVYPVVQNADYSLPTGATWTFPVTAIYPQFTFSPNLLKLLGYPSEDGSYNQVLFPLNATYPAGINTIVFLSNIAPQLNSVYAYLICLNICESKLSAVPNLLHQQAITSGFGSLISYNNFSSSSVSCSKGFFNEIIISFQDQNFNPLFLLDKDVTITLAIDFYI